MSLYTVSSEKMECFDAVQITPETLANLDLDEVGHSFLALATL